MGLAYIHYSNCITYNIWQDHFFLNPNFNAFLWFNTSEFDPDSVVKGGKKFYSQEHSISQGAVWQQKHKKLCKYAKRNFERNFCH